MNATITLSADVQKSDPAKVPQSVACRIERVYEWGQREEPKPQTAIYQNTPATDHPALDHSWNEHQMTATDTVGIYLGCGLVAVVTTEP